ncbi:TIGR04222 domain-containing membrane protein [Streptomyces bambusae]|uniref:TIGR04222 domain-containing membrane protein n=1 Tax=Streptomyces bambusae TaxID=1550616 RepID=A0ABS6Z792_9ACTN|nr:TIGR04222 domain-containing membrane protein [Streptomyces bambusae]MBW5483612.1 TIGR04222 domain-containing membrane protein [Streptomyces bambusae]
MSVLAVLVWFAVIGSSVALGRGVVRQRPGARVVAPRLHDLSEAAFVAGGPGRVVDTALVSLLGDGRLVVGGPGIVRMRPGARAADPAEQAVLHACHAASSGALHMVRYEAMLHPAVQEIGDGLAARSLIAPPGSGRRWRRWGVAQAVICGVMIPVSFILTVVQFAVDTQVHGGPMPFVVLVIPVLAGGTYVGALYAARARGRATPAGMRALRRVRRVHLNDSTPHVQVALYGLRGLQDPVLREQLVQAARYTPGVAAASSPSHTRSRTSSTSSGGGTADDGVEFVPVVWCASVDGGGAGGCGSTSEGGAGGSGGSGGSGGCASGSSCSAGSGSSCSSSSSSSWSSSSSCGSSSSGSSCGSSSSS